MALSDEVKSRVADAVLVDLTNPRGTSATTVNDAILDKASGDVEADFKTWANEAFDLTVDQHISLAIEGVILKLTFWSGNTEVNFKFWYDKLEALSRVRARDKIRPKTTSELTPSKEVLGTETVRPHFDAVNFDDIRPDDPT